MAGNYIPKYYVNDVVIINKGQYKGRKGKVTYVNFSQIGVTLFPEDLDGLEKDQFGRTITPVHELGYWAQEIYKYIPN